MRPFQPGIAAKLNKPVRLALGILTISPIVLFTAYIATFWSVIHPTFIAGANSRSLQPPTLKAQVLVAAFGAFIYLVVYALVALYIVDVFRNDYIIGDRKVLWAAVLFLGSFIAMPVYWYLYFWRDKSKDPPPFSAPSGQYLPYPPYTQSPPSTPPPPYYPPYPQYPPQPVPSPQPASPPVPPAPPAL